MKFHSLMIPWNWQWLIDNIIEFCALKLCTFKSIVIAACAIIYTP